MAVLMNLIVKLLKTDPDGAALKKRISELNKELPQALDDRSRALADVDRMKLWDTLGIPYGPDLAEKISQRVEKTSAHVDNIVKQSAALEGIRDRMDARRWRWGAPVLVTVVVESVKAGFKWLLDG